MTLGVQFGSGPKYEQMSSAHPSDPNPQITHPHEMGGSTASTPQWPSEWDEDAHNASWGQHDMSLPAEPQPQPKITGGLGQKPRWDD